MMGFGGIGLLLIVAVIFFVLKYLPDQSPNSKKDFSSAKDMLDKRFVSGEISREEYEEKKRALI